MLNTQVVGKYIDPERHEPRIAAFREKTGVDVQFDDLLLVANGFFTNYRCPLAFRGDSKKFGIVCEPLSFRVAHLVASLLLAAAIIAAVAIGPAGLSVSLVVTILGAAILCGGLVYGGIGFINSRSLHRNPLLFSSKGSGEIACHNGAYQVSRDDVVCLLSVRTRAQDNRRQKDAVKIGGVIRVGKVNAVRHQTPLQLQVKLIANSPTTGERECFVVEQFMQGAVDMYDKVLKPFAKHAGIPFVHGEFDQGMQQVTLTKIV